ncbi:transporter [Thioalkalivibrio denitrificans]|uniref:Transporter n=2 Tax=Thioalkalivibrio denitrificans TaxID=108003 RepID=A0A1V3NRQ0_9GAMM|nr:transporter [Thioalkalivibrio denitrificans]
MDSRGAEQRPVRLDEHATMPGDGEREAGLRLQLPEDWAPAVTPGRTLELSIENAVYLALRHNRSLSVEQLRPLITGTFEATERALFDPVFFAEASVGRERVVRQLEEVGQVDLITTDRDLLEAGARQRFPTGTEVELSLRSVRSDSTRVEEEQFSARAGITLTQALLRGARVESNLARLRQAELDTLASEYELRGFAEALVADVEQTYWEYVLADRRTEIFAEALAVAEQQLSETRSRIAVGQRPETEETAALAEVALRRQGLINARAQKAAARMRLLQLINPAGADWNTEIVLEDTPEPMTFPLDPVDLHVRLSHQLRPELNEARIRARRGELEVIRTRQGLLPRLDLFITLGESGYASAFGRAWRDLDGPGYDYRLGLRFEVPFGNRAAQAESRRARLTRQQSLEAVANLAQLTALDVQTAWLETERTREQISATRVTRELQEEVLRAEQARFRVGTGTALALAQAQRDLLESQLEEVEAVIRHRQALADLYRQSGTLLMRRGIAAPGDEEVVL